MKVFRWLQIKPIFICLCTLLFAIFKVAMITAAPTTGCSYSVDYGSYTHEFELWGEVRVVEPNQGADIQVYLAKSGEMVADLIICWTDKEPKGCGEWRRVSKGEDFTVCFVKDWHDADLIVMYGNPAEFYRTTDPF